MDLHLYLLGEINEYLTIDESKRFIEIAGAELDFSDYNAFQMKKKLIKKIRGFIYKYLDKTRIIYFENFLNVKEFEMVSHYTDNSSNNYLMRIKELQIYRYKDYFIKYRVFELGEKEDDVFFWDIISNKDTENFVNKYITIVHKKDFDFNNMRKLPYKTDELKFFKTVYPNEYRKKFQEYKDRKFSFFGSK